MFYRNRPQASWVLGPKTLEHSVIIARDAAEVDVHRHHALVAGLVQVFESIAAEVKS